MGGVTFPFDSNIVIWSNGLLTTLFYFYFIFILFYLNSPWVKLTKHQLYLRDETKGKKFRIYSMRSHGLVKVIHIRYRCRRTRTLSVFVDGFSIASVLIWKGSRRLWLMHCGIQNSIYWSYVTLATVIGVNCLHLLTTNSFTTNDLKLIELRFVDAYCP